MVFEGNQTLSLPDSHSFVILIVFLLNQFTLLLLFLLIFADF